MNKLTIAVEPDGVIYDIFTATRNQLLKHMNLDWVSKGLKKYPMPVPTAGKYWDVPEETFKRVAAENAFELFAHGPLLARARGAIEVLSAVDHYEVFFLTTPRGDEGSRQWNDSLNGKKKWLAENGLGHIRLETTVAKTPDEHHFDALVDSDAQSLRMASRAGATTIGIFSKSSENRGFPIESIDFFDFFDAVEYLKHT